MLSDVFFTKEFYRSFYDLLEKNIAPVYNYEFKYDGGLNVGKQFVSLTKPYTKRLKGNSFLLYSSNSNYHENKNNHRCMSRGRIGIFVLCKIIKIIT